MKIVALFLFVLAVFGATRTWLATSRDQTVASDQVISTAMPVKTIVLEPLSSIVKERQFTGTIVASRRARLAFERSARLIKVLVDDGQTVSEGQVLAEIDRRQLTARVAEVVAMLNQQRAVLAELEAGPRRETIAATKAILAASSVDMELRKATLDRVQDLHKRGATSAQNLDEVRLAWKFSAAQRDAVVMQLEELEAGTRIEQIDAQKAVVAGLEAQLERLQIDVADSELKAPFAGTIMQRTADEGDMLNAQQPLFELLETGCLEARIGVPSALVGSLNREGYHVLSANGVEVTGRIRSVLSEVNSATRTQTVVIDIDKGQGSQLADGQLVRMNFDETLAMKGYRVPLSALASGSRGLWTVYVIEAGDEDSARHIIGARAVEVLHTDGNGAVIRGAVYSGEHLVCDGIHRVVPGQIVVDGGESSADPALVRPSAEKD